MYLYVCQYEHVYTHIEYMHAYILLNKKWIKKEGKFKRKKKKKFADR